MNLLLIETSSERAIVAIACDREMRDCADLPFGFHNSRYLVPTIEEGLKRAGLAIEEIGAIGVGVGPGSYTGMRVGAVTAKTLAFARALPLIGICSLQTFIPTAEGAFTVLIDAKISGAYVTHGVQRGGVGGDYSAPEVVPLERLRLQSGARIVTPHAARLKEKLDALHPGNQWQWEERAPSALQMAFLAKEKLAQGTFSLDGHLELLYLRKTQAEMDVLKKSGFLFAC